MAGVFVYQLDVFQILTIWANSDCLGPISGGSSEFLAFFRAFLLNIGARPRSAAEEFVGSILLPQSLPRLNHASQNPPQLLYEAGIVVIVL